MKLILILSVIVAIAFSYSGISPRSDYHCDGNVSGSFWDGQKCEKCYNDACFCHSSQKVLGCDSCKDTYGYYTPSGSTQATCVPCSEDGVTKCCVKGQSQIDSSYAIRATECLKRQVPGDSFDYRLYGSYCHRSPNCINYNDFGQCTSCRDGYYLNAAHSCSACSASAGQCAKCVGPQSCTECGRTYYKEFSTDTTAIKSAYSCKECNVNCWCTGKADSAGVARLCEGCAYDNGFFFDSKALTCNSCTTVHAQCITCKSATECTQCSARWQLSLKEKNKCLECPKNCTQCEVKDLTGEKTSCKAGFCENGYYEAKGSSGEIVCNLCTGEYVIRCKAGVAEKDAPIPTQCQSPGQSPKTVNGDESDPRNGSPKAAYLLTVSTGAKQCVANSRLCKKMIDNVAEASKGSCDTCYDEFGYVKIQVNDKFECQQCSKIIPASSCKACDVKDNKLVCKECYTNKEVDFWGEVDTEQNYYLLEGVCKACTKGCLKCDGDTPEKCQTAQQGWVKSASGTQIIKCTVTNCKKCSEDGKCSECFEKFYKPTGKETCEPCFSSCYKCGSTPYDCTECNAGKFLRGNTCLDKQAQCIVYSKNGGSCSECKYGYRVVDGFCVPGFAVGQAYINLFKGCSSTKYQVDGTWLNTEKSSSSSQSTILQIAIYLIIVSLSIILF